MSGSISISDAATDTAGTYDRARQCLSRGQLPAAQQLCLQILKRDRGHAGAHFLLGVISVQLGRLKNAAEFLEEAVRLDNQLAEAWAQLARVRSLQRDDLAADEAARTAESIGSRDGYVWDTLGVVYTRMSRFESAERMFRKAVRHSPATPGYWFDLGSCLQFLGRIDESAAAYEKAIAAGPAFYRAHYALSMLRRARDVDNRIARLEDLLNRCWDLDGQLQLGYALAKEYEDLGRHDQAMRYWDQVNRKKHETLSHDSSETDRLIDRLEEIFPESIDGRSGFPAEGALFIVGLPRTGTTLVERILSQHPSVVAGGELSHLGVILAESAAVDSGRGRALTAELLTQAAQADPAAVGKTYFERCRALVGSEGHYLTDKTPLNFLFLGHIGQALANAKIICLRRNPMDTVLSNYRQLFALHQSYYDYSYNLEDSARFYVQFHRLMEHWRHVLPNRILEVEYEQLVASPEIEIRRMLDYLELDWDDACLRFESNAAPVATASAVQVREPINARAVGRWRQYETRLGGARRIIEDAGIAIE